jgi:hypothetical protein
VFGVRIRLDRKGITRIPHAHSATSFSYLLLRRFPGTTDHAMSRCVDPGSKLEATLPKQKRIEHFLVSSTALNIRGCHQWSGKTDG